MSGNDPRALLLPTWYFIHLWRHDLLSIASHSTLVLIWSKSLRQIPWEQRWLNTVPGSWRQQAASRACLESSVCSPTPCIPWEIFWRVGKKRNWDMLKRTSSTLNPDFTSIHFRLWMEEEEKKWKREELKRKRDNNKERCNTEHWLKALESNWHWFESQFCSLTNLC